MKLPKHYTVSISLLFGELCKIAATKIRIIFIFICSVKFPDAYLYRNCSFLITTTLTGNSELPSYIL